MPNYATQNFTYTTYKFTKLRMKISAATRKLTPHLPFLAVLLGGLLLRFWAVLAYHPGLLFYGDSEFYMQNAIDLSPLSFHPLGYAFFLRLMTVTGKLWTVSLTQHALCLLAGILLYLFLRRVGLNKWLAALGSAPILLDAYGIDLESTVLTEALVSALLVATFVILFWNRKTPSKLALASAGVILAFTTITRTSVAVMVLPMLAYVFFTVRAQTHRIRRALMPLGILLVAFAVPVVGYCAYHYSFDNHFTIDTKTPFFLYSRVSPLVNCTALSKANQLLCSPIPKVASEKHDINWYLWGLDAPLRANYTAPRLSVFDLPEGNLQQFDVAALKQRPWPYLTSTLGEAISYFGVNNVKNRQDSSPTNLQFPTKPVWNPYVRLANESFSPVVAIAKDPARLPSESAAKELHAYQHFGYVPGPALGVAVVIVAIAVWLRRNRKALIAATLTSSALLYLLLTCALAGPYYRYIVPVESLFVVGGVLGLDVILDHMRTRKPRRHAHKPNATR